MEADFQYMYLLSIKIRWSRVKINLITNWTAAAPQLEVKVEFYRNLWKHVWDQSEFDGRSYLSVSFFLQWKVFFGHSYAVSSGQNEESHNSSFKQIWNLWTIRMLICSAVIWIPEVAKCVESIFVQCPVGAYFGCWRYLVNIIVRWTRDGRG